MTHHEDLAQADRLIADCMDISPANANSSQPCIKIGPASRTVLADETLVRVPPLATDVAESVCGH